MCSTRCDMGQLPFQKADEIATDVPRKLTDGDLRSSEGEAARQVDVATARKLVDEIRHRLGGREHSDSTDLIREDRDR